MLAYQKKDTGLCQMAAVPFLPSVARTLSRESLQTSQRAAECRAVGIESSHEYSWRQVPYNLWPSTWRAGEQEST